MSEAHVRRLQSSRAQPVERQSLTLSGSESRIRKAPTEDLLDKVLQGKRLKTHQPLTATLAGTHTLISSGRMLSTKPRWANQSDDESNSNEKRSRDGDDPRDFSSQRRRGGNPDGDGDGGDDGDDYGRGRGS